VAAVVSGLALPADVVSVRRTRTRGVSEMTLRRQLALVATPRVERFVFVRRVTLRAAPQSIGSVMQAALIRLADGAVQEVLSYADFPALVVACARAALASSLGGSWHWRTLGLSPTAGPGEAVSALLTAHPLEAGSAVAALAEAELLAPAWRQMPAASAVEVVRALAAATGFSLPAWPVALPTEPPPASAAPVLDRAALLWAPVLATLPPASPLVMAAAVLALLRWSPTVLRSVDNPIWPALVARISGHAAGAAPPPTAHTAPDVGAKAPSARSEPPALPAGADAALHEDVQVTADVPDAPRGETLITQWGGVLFLVNALTRLDIEAQLETLDPAAPTGWRLLHALGVACGMPPKEPLAKFLDAQDLETAIPADLLAGLMDRLDALYRPDGPWPLPLRQLAWLTATETHLDISLGAATVDVALRLSGLDLDPGWVPWLGRVVRFHYDRMPTYGSDLPRTGGAGRRTDCDAAGS
jgi:hypothetical protein